VGGQGIAERRRHGKHPARDHGLAQVAPLGQPGPGQHHEGRHQHADGGQETYFKGAGAQPPLIDDAKGDEGAGTEAGQPVGEEE